MRANPTLWYLARLACLLPACLPACSNSSDGECCNVGATSNDPAKRITPADKSKSGAPEAVNPNIELLGFPSCPNTAALRANLKAALSSIGGGLTFKDSNQEELPSDDLRRGWPAPTILVNGRDLFGMAPPTIAVMGCRMYEGGLPATEVIAEALRNATSR